MHQLDSLQSNRILLNKIEAVLLPQRVKTDTTIKIKKKKKTHNCKIDMYSSLRSKSKTFAILQCGKKVGND